MDTVQIEFDYRDSWEGIVYRVQALEGSEADEALKQCFLRREQLTLGNKKGWLTETSGYGGQSIYKLLLADTAPVGAFF